MIMPKAKTLQPSNSQFLHPLHSRGGLRRVESASCHHQRDRVSSSPRSRTIEQQDRCRRNMAGYESEIFSPLRKALLRSLHTSIGQPLGQCRSVSALLIAIFCLGESHDETTRRLTTVPTPLKSFQQYSTPSFPRK